MNLILQLFIALAFFFGAFFLAVLILDATWDWSMRRQFRLRAGGRA